VATATMEQIQHSKNSTVGNEAVVTFVNTRKVERFVQEEC